MKNYIRGLAKELYITLTPEDEKALLAALVVFKEQADVLGQIDNVDEVEPLIFPYSRTTTYLREDIVEPVPSQAEILKNSKNNDGQFVVIPKVVK